MKKKTVDEIYVRLTDIQRREYLKRFEKFSVNMQILFVSCLIFGGALFLGFAIGSLSVCAIIDVMFCLILFFVTLYVDYVYDHKKYRQMIFILGAKTWMEIEKVVSPFDSEQAKNSNLTTKSRKSESSEVSQINNGITEENESVTSVVTDNGQNNCEIQKEEVIESLQSNSASIAENESVVGVTEGIAQDDCLNNCEIQKKEVIESLQMDSESIDESESFAIGIQSLCNVIRQIINFKFQKKTESLKNLQAKGGLIAETESVVGVTKGDTQGNISKISVDKFNDFSILFIKQIVLTHCCLF